MRSVIKAVLIVVIVALVAVALALIAHKPRPPPGSLDDVMARNEEWIRNLGHDRSSSEATPVASPERSLPRAPTPPPTVYSTGQDVTVGHMTYTVVRSWFSRRVSANQFSDRPPDAMYLFVDVIVANADREESDDSIVQARRRKRIRIRH